MASAIFNACRRFASVCPTSEPISVPMSSIRVGLPVSFPKALANALFPVPLTPKSNTPRGLTVPARPKSTPTEILEIAQAAERIEVLLATVKREQVVLPECLGLQLPDGLGPDGVVPGQ